MQEHHIEKIVEETLQSLDGTKRAEPKPFLLTRVMASINRQSSVKNIWTKAGVFISRPGIAIAGITFILCINTSILLLNRKVPDKNPVAQNSNSITDEFAVNAANIYDIENQEP